jgi:hypothetical protein
VMLTAVADAAAPGTSRVTAVLGNVASVTCTLPAGTLLVVRDSAGMMLAQVCAPASGCDSGQASQLAAGAQVSQAVSWQAAVPQCTPLGCPTPQPQKLTVQWGPGTTTVTVGTAVAATPVTP